MSFWVISGHKKSGLLFLIQQAAYITLFYCFFLVQISRLPVGLSNRPPPTKQIASVNLHYLIILPHSVFFVNDQFLKNLRNMYFIVLVS